MHNGEAEIARLTLKYRRRMRRELQRTGGGSTASARTSRNASRGRRERGASDVTGTVGSHSLLPHGIASASFSTSHNAASAAAAGDASDGLGSPPTPASAYSGSGGASGSQAPPPQRHRTGPSGPLTPPPHPHAHSHSHMSPPRQQHPSVVHHHSALAPRATATTPPPLPVAALPPYPMHGQHRGSPQHVAQGGGASNYAPPLHYMHRGGSPAGSVGSHGSGSGGGGGRSGGGGGRRGQQVSLSGTSPGLLAMFGDGSQQRT